jgi:hypothetical protein
VKEFAEEMKDVARECYRVLKPNHFWAILIGDTRRNLHYVPVAFRTLNSFLEVGFILREDIIKHQWQCKYGIRSAEGAGFGEFLFDPFSEEKRSFFRQSGVFDSTRFLWSQSKRTEVQRKKGWVSIFLCLGSQEKVRRRRNSKRVCFNPYGFTFYLLPNPLPPTP